MTDGDGDVGHLQRRDLQLRRAARGARRASASARTSDTEVHPARLPRAGASTAWTQLRGMFAFALWDEREQTLFCARDRFGIKPFYYAQVDGVLYFASEVKALLPFLPTIETDPEAPAGLPHVPVLPARQDAVPRTSRSCCRATTCSSRRRPGRACGATGRSTTSSTSTTRSATSQDRLDELVRRLRAAAPAQRRAGRRLRLRRPRLEHRRRRSPRAAGRPRLPGLHGHASTSARRYDESRYARDRRRPARLRAARGRHHARGLRATILPDVIYHLDYPGRRPRLVPAVHGLGARRDSTSRSCSAARAATRSSAATRAT